MIDMQMLAQMLASQSGFSNPFGPPGYGWEYANLPSPGVPFGSITRGQSFIAPYLPNPHHLKFGDSALGSIAGLLTESFMQSRGQTYMPSGVNPTDVLYGRAYQQNLTAAGQIGSAYDTNRMAQMGTGLMDMILGANPAHRSTMNALMSTVNATGMGPVLTNMLSPYMPGLGAGQFSTQAFQATRLISDYTNKVGGNMPASEALALSGRLLNQFSTAGAWDPVKTRGLSFPDMGNLMTELGGRGLLSGGAEPGQIKGLAKDLGMSPGDASLKSIAGSVNIGKQLTQYADVVRTMRELMGKPDAPVNQIISDLQAITGGNMQGMDPSKLRQMVDKMQEMRKTLNISGEALSQMAQMNADLFTRMGLNGSVGADNAMRAAGATAANQKANGGWFAGKASQEQENSTRMQIENRVSVDPRMRMAAQTIRMLENLKYDSLTDDQKATYTKVYNKAMDVGYRSENIGTLQGELETLGLGRNATAQALNSNVGVDQTMLEHPELKTAGYKQARAGIKDRMRAAMTRFGMASVNEGSDIGKQIEQMAHASNKTREEVAGILGSAWEGAAKGTPEEMKKQLKKAGLDTTGFNAQSFYGLAQGNSEVNAVMGAYMDKGVARTFEQMTYLHGDKAYNASQKAADEVERNMIGHKLAADIGLKQSGTAVDRALGALMRGKATDVKSWMTAAFGFVPSTELTGDITQNTVTEMNRLGAELTKLTGDKSPQAEERRKEIHKEMGVVLETKMTKMFSNPDTAATKSITKLRNGISDADLRRADRVRSGMATENDIGLLAGTVAHWTDKQIDNAAKAMSPEKAADFRSNVLRMREGSDEAKRLLSKLANATSDDEKEDIKREIKNSDVIKSGLGLVGQTRADLDRETMRVARGQATMSTGDKLELFAKGQTLRAKLQRSDLSASERMGVINELKGLSDEFEIAGITSHGKVNQAFVTELHGRDTRAGGTRKDSEDAVKGVVETLRSSVSAEGGLVNTFNQYGTGVDTKRYATRELTSAEKEQMQKDPTSKLGSTNKSIKELYALLTDTKGDPRTNALMARRKIGRDENLKDAETFNAVLDASDLNAEQRGLMRNAREWATTARKPGSGVVDFDKFLKDKTEKQDGKKDAAAGTAGSGGSITVKFLDAAGQAIKDGVLNIVVNSSGSTSVAAKEGADAVTPIDRNVQPGHGT